MFKYSLRLPLGPFFSVMSLLIALLAIVFAGQGVAALQEAGVVGASPVGPSSRCGCSGCIRRWRRSARRSLTAVLIVLGMWAGQRESSPSAEPKPRHPRLP